MPKLTVKELLELKGVRQIAFVQVAREEEALAAAAAGMDMMGPAFTRRRDIFQRWCRSSIFNLASPGVDMRVPRPPSAKRCRPWKPALNPYTAQ